MTTKSRYVLHVGPPWLPLPVAPNATKLGRDEWRDYRRCRALHLAEHPAYDQAFRRPPSVSVLELVARQRTTTVDALVSEVMPSWTWLTDDDKAEVRQTLAQALIVVLDRVIAGAEVPLRDDEDDGEPEGLAVHNAIFDALARGWSDHYIRAAGDLRNISSWSMRDEDNRGAWRDLTRNGISPRRLLDFALGGVPGLYAVHKPKYRWNRAKQDWAWDRYRVAVDYESGLWAEWVRTLGRWRTSRHPRLLLADEPADSLPEHCQVVQGWRYNVATIGDRSWDVIDQLASTPLHLNVGLFESDFAMTLAQYEQVCRDLTAQGMDLTLPGSLPRERQVTTVITETGRYSNRNRTPREKAMRHLDPQSYIAVLSLWRRYDKLRGRVSSMRTIHDDLAGVATPPAGGWSPESAYRNPVFLPIRSRFYKTMNRRYQAADFWPSETSSKMILNDGVTVGSPRGRWFWGELNGTDRRNLTAVDVSASQVQILSVFLGLERLEARIQQESFKIIAARLALRRHADPNDRFKLPSRYGVADFSLEDDPDRIDQRLLAAIKKAVMTHLYGSRLVTVAERLDESPEEFGPGLGDAMNIRRLLYDKELMLGGILRHYLPACRVIAREAFKTDNYRGVVFTDPFDGATVRWNPVPLMPIRKLTRSAGVNDFAVLANRPVTPQNAAGDYAVDVEIDEQGRATGKLVRDIAPCLIHTLDAAFAGLVVERLRNKADTVSIHDAWYVPSGYRDRLDAAVADAGQEWYESLGPVYDMLVHYLGPHPKHGSWAIRLKQGWERRRDAARQNPRLWPRLRVGDARPLRGLNDEERAQHSNLLRQVYESPYLVSR